MQNTHTHTHTSLLIMGLLQVFLAAVELLPKLLEVPLLEDPIRSSPLFKTRTHTYTLNVYTHIAHKHWENVGEMGGGRERTQRRRGDWKLCNGASASTLQIHNALCIVEKLLKGKEEPRLWIPCPSFWQSKNLGEEEALPVRSDIVKQTTSPPQP